MTIENKNVQSLIISTWEKVVKEVNNAPDFFPSEKTIVFRFAWLFQKNLGVDIHFHFEKIVLKNNPHKRKLYLDLFFELNGKKIGVEFKFPKKSELSSNNQTQRRISIVKDIDRLNCLVFNKEIDLGVFLLASDIRAYTNDSVKRTTSKIYKVHQNHSYKKGETLPPFENEQQVLVCDVNFIWNDVDKMKLRERFAWISPIFISY